MTSFETLYERELESVPEEHYDRERFVPGVGSDEADVMIVGEAPGEQEVARGEPFVGPAGGELDRALEAAGIDRDELYVTNVVKVRPPENRSPRVAEIEAWRPVLEAEIDRVDPEVIVPVGNTATRAILDVEEGITEIHGRRFEVDGRVVVPTFHPAALFYDRSKQEGFERDIRRAFEAAG